MLYRQGGGTSSAPTSSEAFLYPNSVFGVCQNFKDNIAVFISRSGESIETVRALEKAKQYKIHTLSVTCNGAGKIAKNSDECIVLSHAMEDTILESFSFESMLAALCAATGEALPDSVSFLDGIGLEMDLLLKKWFGNASPESFLCIGSGALGWVAAEGALKFSELTGVHSESYSSFEYRHGPRMQAGPGTLAFILSSEEAYFDEIRLALELEDYGAKVLWFGDFEGERQAVSASTGSRVGDLIAASYLLKKLAIIHGRGKGRNFDSPAHLQYSVTEFGGKR